MISSSAHHSYKLPVAASLACFVIFAFISAALAYNPNKFPGKGSRAAWLQSCAICNEGVALANRGKYLDAIRSYKRASTIYPYDAANYFNAGNSFSKLAEYVEAAKYYQKAIELAPDYEKAYFNMGNSLWKLKELKGAEKAYRNAIDLNPKYIDPKINLGELLLEMKRPSEAKKVLLEAQALPDAKLAENRNMIEDDLRKAQKQSGSFGRLQAGD